MSVARAKSGGGPPRSTRQRDLRLVTYPGSPHALKRSVEVGNAQEESDPPRELVPYRRRLGVAVCLSEEQAGARSWRSHNDPAFRLTVVGDRAGVLDQFKPERTNEKLNRETVVLDDQRNQLEVHTRQATQTMRAD
jgi:hypothetical protein